MKTIHRSLLHAVLLIMFVISTDLHYNIAFAATLAQVPNQFIAKMYTEALGRLPDQASWNNQVNYILQNGCNVASLKNIGYGAYTSPEFNGLGYDYAAKVLALYRGALNREPDVSGFNNLVNQLNNGTLSWVQAVNSMFNSAEFSQIVNGSPEPGIPAICTTPTYPYRWRSSLVIDITGNMSQIALQNAIDAASNNGGGTIALSQKLVVRLTSTLMIRSNVVLTTVGNPVPQQYALMARLVRDGNFNAPAVLVQPGGQLKSTWVDGQINRFGYSPNRITVQIRDDNTPLIAYVERNRISDTAGWTHLFLNEYIDTQALCGSVTLDNYSIVGVYIRDNLITGYALAGAGDGISLRCGNAVVDNNKIIDVTDVGIVQFSAYPYIQHSEVKNNTILNAGNAAMGGLAYDPGVGLGVSDYSGSSFHDNILWTSDSSFMRIALSVGSRPWFNYPDYQISKSQNTNMTNNTKGSSAVKLNTTMKILVVDAINPTVQNNSFSANTSAYSSCSPIYNGIVVANDTVFSLINTNNGSVTNISPSSTLTNCLNN